MRDLNRTRPINLTEQLLKVYERVMMGRVVAAIEKHKILDMSQDGAVARAGVQAPLRVIAEVMDDARVPGQELHLFATDLSTKPLTPGVLVTGPQLEEPGHA